MTGCNAARRAALCLIWMTTQKRKTMQHNYRETDEDCKGCGATAGDRKRNQPTQPQGLSSCPHCEANKCCMCDMGDDVGCVRCDLED